MSPAVSLWRGMFLCFAVLQSSAHADWYHLPDEQRKPQHFEPYLEKFPQDESRRAAAMIWYARGPSGERNFERLKFHTLQLIANHPSSLTISDANSTAFYQYPEYRVEVIGLLENQIKKGQSTLGVLANLGKICAQGAIPRIKSPRDRQRLLRDHGIPLDTEYPTKIDLPLAEKAVGYYRSAIALCTDGHFLSCYSEDLADLLCDLGRYDEAVAVCENVAACEKVFPNKDLFWKPENLAVYGRCLAAAKKTEEARKILKQVRKADEESEAKPEGRKEAGIATARAETTLAEIAFNAGDMAGARRHLLESLRIGKDWYGVTYRYSLDLAEKLLERGETNAVIAFCETAIKEFAPRASDTADLLKKAKEDAGKAR